MIKKIVFATGNQNKVREAAEILSALGLEVISQKEAGVEADVEETGTSFTENALLKARAVAVKCPDMVVIADDSGLVVDALGGEPGIYSSRYMGEDTPYDVKNREIIKRLSGVEGQARSARFVCAIAAVLPGGKELSALGTVEGIIAHEPYGQGGFGYDPIFLVPELGKTTAEMTSDEKNKISHRGKAMRAMCGLLEKECK
ncbi:MAG: RdgB/HAM1 family non-canonical purine NTP pyrophosphatase [Lachnospiraceae bacterium]|nr:RdgB/HAM1 family non-canonical purine NTP pyrophosphatase [Lachnospiraceae bacterium]